MKLIAELEISLKGECFTATVLPIWKVCPSMESNYEQKVFLNGK